MVQLDDETLELLHTLTAFYNDIVAVRDDDLQQLADEAASIIKKNYLTSKNTIRALEAILTNHNRLPTFVEMIPLLMADTTFNFGFHILAERTIAYLSKTNQIQYDCPSRYFKPTAEEIVTNYEPSTENQVIFNDDIEKFREICANFYEKFLENDPFGGPPKESMFDYVAQYGAINCFKFLVMNKVPSDSLLRQKFSTCRNLDMIEIYDRVFRVNNENMDGALRANNEQLISFCHGVGIEYAYFPAFYYYNFPVFEDILVNLKDIKKVDFQKIPVTKAVISADMKLLLKPLFELNPNGSVYDAVRFDCIDTFRWFLSKRPSILTMKMEGQKNWLHVACENGAFEIAKLLVEEKNFSISETDAMGNTPLHLAIEANQQPPGNGNEVAKYLIKKRANVKAKNKMGVSPYIALIQKCSWDTELYELFMSKNCDINSIDQLGMTHLMALAERGYYKSAEMFLKKGANKDLHDNNDGRSALHFAANHDDPKMIDLLLKYGAKLENMTTLGHNPFLEAVEFDSLNAIKCLYKHGSKVNYVTRDNMTPLMIAARYGMFKSVKALIDIGVNLDTQTTLPIKSALEMSVERGHNHITQLLVNSGANMEKYGTATSSIIHYAINQKNHVAVQIFVEHGCDLNSKEDKTGNTPLFTAYKKKQINLFAYLLRHGADPNVRNAKGEHLMNVLGKDPKENIEYVRILITYAIDPTIKDDKGRTFLFQWTELNMPDIVRVLLKRNVDPNLKDQQGNTPLHYAVQKKYYECAYNLVEFGARPDMQNNNGLTPERIAESMGDQSLIDIVSQ